MKNRQLSEQAKNLFYRASGSLSSKPAALEKLNNMAGPPSHLSMVFPQYAAFSFEIVIDKTELLSKSSKLVGDAL